jgi:hypothetical protein
MLIHLVGLLVVSPAERFGEAVRRKLISSLEKQKNSHNHTDTDADTEVLVPINALHIVQALQLSPVVVCERPRLCPNYASLSPSSCMIYP